MDYIILFVFLFAIIVVAIKNNRPSPKCAVIY